SNRLFTSSLFFFFSRYTHHRDLHSFPTRRSSDLNVARLHIMMFFKRPNFILNTCACLLRSSMPVAKWLNCSRLPCKPKLSSCVRSEEHTSELQSRSDLVCRLLLEKKKNPIQT